MVESATATDCCDALFSDVADTVKIDVVDLAAFNLNTRGVQLSVLRLDQLNPVSGNKLFKLKNNVREAQRRGCRRIVSFGGAYSNHIYALALLGKELAWPTVGLIRGELVQPLNVTLSDAVVAGMQLIGVSRQEYRRRHDADYLHNIQQRWPDAWIVPEGGGNQWGVQGCRDIVFLLDGLIPDGFDVVTLPCGTGATLAGVASALVPPRRVVGYSVLKDGGSLDIAVDDYLRHMGMFDASNKWHICRDFHCGGYAKTTAELWQFADNFSRTTGIALDPVYTAKMFYGLFNQIAQGDFAPGTRIVAIHTGGLQGARSMRNPNLKVSPITAAENGNG